MATTILGDNGVVTVYEPDGCWKTWALAEVWTGGAIGTPTIAKYVPKVNDYVIDYSTDEKYIVTAIDETTLKSTLKKITTGVISEDLSDTDRLLGVGPGTQSDTYRVYIDQSVIPHTLAVDARLRVAGTMCSYAKIFKGSELDGTAKVISAFYDQSGNLLGQNVPLELVMVPNGQNYSIKTVSVCYTTEKLVDGEVVTVVFYSDTGGVVSKRQLLVENTAYIRTTDASQKYITHISLETPFLSDSDPTLIQYPINVPLEGFNLFGKVHYSDGSSLTMPVDSTKFALFGLENYVATIIGQKLNLVLRYNLSEGEIVYGASVADGKFLTEVYQAITTKADGNYSVKLFGYPVWIDEINGYRLEWFLFNLDRQTYYNVTPYVKFNENSPAFKPLAFGSNQSLSVSINLQDVNGVFKKYVHTQTIEIMLVRGGMDMSGTNWSIGFEPAQNPQYGRNNHADLTFINQNLRKVKIDLGETELTNWLERIFYLTKPLHDPDKELVAPEPNMFALVLDGTEITYPISQWNSELTFSQNLDVGDTLFVKFFKRTPETDLLLGVSGLPVWQAT